MDFRNGAMEWAAKPEVAKNSLTAVLPSNASMNGKSVEQAIRSHHSPAVVDSRQVVWTSWEGVPAALGRDF